MHAKTTLNHLDPLQLLLQTVQSINTVCLSTLIVFLCLPTKPLITHGHYVMCRRHFPTVVIRHAPVMTLSLTAKVKNFRPGSQNLITLECLLSTRNKTDHHRSLLQTQAQVTSVHEASGSPPFPPSLDITSSNTPTLHCLFELGNKI